MLSELRERGFTVTALDDGRLGIKPRPSAELLARVVAHKPEILRALANEAGPQFPRWPKGRAAPYSSKRIRSLQKRATGAGGWSWW